MYNWEVKQDAELFVSMLFWCRLLSGFGFRDRSHLRPEREWYRTADWNITKAVCSTPCTGCRPS